ncbi:MAG: transposase [Aphanocapsa sp. GSE-SYN-MK-11-07L]|nr:transposase [Aphanocapsa sp. GSE-SYN-MK-11-07L]
MVTLKAIYRLAGRQCQRFVESIFELMGIDLNQYVFPIAS